MAAAIRYGWLASEVVNTFAEPSYWVAIAAGRARDRSILWIAPMASPSENPGARLNDRVTDGNPSWWLIVSGASESSAPVNAANGTSLPEVVDRT